jgi:flagellin-like protein
MNVTYRKAVSPIIATLLLIAIAVASGIIVYVFTGSLAAGLTKSGGSQVTQQVQFLAYNFQAMSGPVTCNGNVTQTAPCLILYFKNTGVSTITLSGVYFSGSALTAAGTLLTTPMTLVQGQTATLILVNAGTPTTARGSYTGLPASVTAGASYVVKLVTTSGGETSFSVVAGQTG